jgi:hypothetical protein
MLTSQPFCVFISGPESPCLRRFQTMAAPSLRHGCRPRSAAGDAGPDGVSTRGADYVCVLITLEIVRAGHGSAYVFQQRTGRFEVVGVEAFSEPVVDRREQLACGVALAALDQQLRERLRTAQLPGSGLLLARTLD